MADLPKYASYDDFKYAAGKLAGKVLAREFKSELDKQEYTKYVWAVGSYGISKFPGEPGDSAKPIWGQAAPTEVPTDEEVAGILQALSEGSEDDFHNPDVEVKAGWLPSDLLKKAAAWALRALADLIA